MDVVGEHRGGPLRTRGISTAGTAQSCHPLVCSEAVVDSAQIARWDGQSSLLFSLLFLLTLSHLWLRTSWMVILWFTSVVSILCIRSFAGSLIGSQSGVSICKFHRVGITRVQDPDERRRDSMESSLARMESTPGVNLESKNDVVTCTLPRQIASRNLSRDPTNGRVPVSRTWSSTPADQTSPGFPYCRRWITSGAMKYGHPTRPARSESFVST